MSDAGTEHDPSHPLLTLIDLGHRARAAAGADELAFLAVNDTRRLVPYRQAVLWFAEGGVRCLSGVVQPEANAPYAQWLHGLCRALNRHDAPFRPLSVNHDDLPADVAAAWDNWLPRHAVWLPLPAGAEHPGSVAGGLLLAGEEIIAEALYPLLSEWAATWHHAWLARFRPRPWSPALWREKLRAWWCGDDGAPWWRRRPVQATLATAAVLLFPVRLTVLAPAELVPANPAVIRAPLDGVVGQFHVRPNDSVKAGQPLFSFDEAPIAARLEVARQALAAAEAEYRQQAQLALSDTRSKGQLAVLMGKIGEKRAEADYLESQFQRAHVTAPQDGVALFDDPAEWIGRPVQTGERIMKVAAPGDVEIEAWIAIGDAIPLPAEADVNLYLASTPLSSLAGRLRYLGHDATPRPDGNYAYRLRARLDGSTDLRVGLKGTAKVHGHWVPFAFWVLRRPLAAIRQFVAL
ncbi:hypothetical protein RHDC4_00207 [Rhodocyclaceae bacterium]|nr:hypothetical protein RHDC4_00207 [Rhodocyclaceae bacterium]